MYKNGSENVSNCCIVEQEILELTKKQSFLVYVPAVNDTKFFLWISVSATITILHSGVNKNKVNVKFIRHPYPLRMSNIYLHSIFKSPKEHPKLSYKKMNFHL